MSAGGSTKVIVISLCANLGIALSKLGGSLYTGSAALLAEAVHSFSDCGNQALLLWGGHVAKKGPSDKYPLGRGKEMFFWSFVVALLLFSMGGIFSLYEGIHKLHSTEPLSNPLVGVIILGIAVALEGFSFYACLREVRAQAPNDSLWNWIKNTMSADLLVIFLEDLAALLGLVFALIALTLAWITGNPFYDALGSCFIGLLLIVVAVILAREVKPMLIGERPAEEYEPKLQAILETTLPGAKLVRLIALQQGVGAVMLAYKINPADTPADVHDVIKSVNQFEAQVRETYPEVKWQFAELDDKD